MPKEKEGLCGWLAKKHKWSKEKKEKCMRNAKRGKKGRKKKLNSANVEGAGNTDWWANKVSNSGT